MRAMVPAWRLAGRAKPRRQHPEALGAGRGSQTMIESHQWHPFRQSFAQIQAAGKLNCIGCAQHMPSQKEPRQRGDLGNELDDVKSGEIVGQGRNRPIAVGRREIALAGAARERGSDLDLRQAARRGISRREQASDASAAAFGDVALDERAGVEVADQKRSSRSRSSVPVTGSPATRIGVNRASRCEGGVTHPRAASLASRPAREAGVASIRRSSATGWWRSVTISRSPCRTRFRYVPRRVFSSREPTRSTGGM
jgi:hypothetical protein